MWRYELKGGMWSRKWRRTEEPTLPELQREVESRGLKLDTPRLDGRIRGSRKLVVVEPKRKRIVARFVRKLSTEPSSKRNAAVSTLDYSKRT